MTIDKIRLAAMAAVLAVAAPAAACAQAAPAPPAEAAAAKRPTMDPAKRAEMRAERLRTVLQLTPAQEPALKAYVASMQPPAGVREGRRAHRSQVAAMTTPQRLEAMRKRMDERRARFDQRAQATLKFYGQLTPAQQKAFDAMGPNRGGHMRGKGGHGFGGGFRG